MFGSKNQARQLENRSKLLAGFHQPIRKQLELSNYGADECKSFDEIMQRAVHLERLLASFTAQDDNARNRTSRSAEASSGKKGASGHQLVLDSRPAQPALSAPSAQAPRPEQGYQAPNSLVAWPSGPPGRAHQPNHAGRGVGRGGYQGGRGYQGNHTAGSQNNQQQGGSGQGGQAGRGQGAVPMDINAVHWQPLGISSALTIVGEDTAEVCQAQVAEEKPSSIFNKMTISMSGYTLLEALSSYHQAQLFQHLKRVPALNGQMPSQPRGPMTDRKVEGANWQATSC